MDIHREEVREGIDRKSKEYLERDIDRERERESVREWDRETFKRT